MDFEQALYRVYDRTLDGLLQDRPLVENVPQTKPRYLCNICLHGLWFFALTLLTIFWGLHLNFVNSPGCLYTTMQTMYEGSEISHLATQPSFTTARAGSSTLSVVREDGNKTLGKSLPLRAAPDPRNASTWLEDDEILQIRIEQSGVYMAEEGGRKGPGRRMRGYSAFPGAERGEAGTSETTEIINDADSNDTALSSFNPDYVYAQNTALLYLDPAFLSRHRVRRVNVSLDEMCMTKGPGLGFVVDVAVGDFNTLLVNQLMFTFRSDGMLRKTRTNETWSWRAESLPPPRGRPFFSLDNWSLKLSALLQSLSAFFFLSGTTAIVVRMLMTSGVALMYPCFFCLRRLGARGLSLGVLARSYAWLGVPMQRLQARGKPLAPFLLAHLCKVLVLYSMYEACQVFFVETLYAKSGASGLPFAVYGLVMLLEYVSMLYVRSALSIKYFPRVVFLYLLAFHLYYYLVPFGFSSLLLLAISLLLLHSVIYVLLFLELPAFRASIVSYDTPRAFYTDTGLPAHPNSIPPSWSLFLPLTLGRRGDDGGRGGAGGVYEEEVPDRPRRGAGVVRVQQVIVERVESRQQRTRSRRGQEEQRGGEEKEGNLGGEARNEEGEAELGVAGYDGEEAVGHVALVLDPGRTGQSEEEGRGEDGSGREQGRRSRGGPRVESRGRILEEDGEEGLEGGQEEGQGFGRRRGYRRLRNDEQF